MQDLQARGEESVKPLKFKPTHLVHVECVKQPWEQLDDELRLLPDVPQVLQQPERPQEREEDVSPMPKER